jgi:glycosyltransferase involved in cell wall biosynthesis
MLFSAPSGFMSAFWLATNLSRHSDRGFFYHMAYLAEACCIVPVMSAFQASHAHAHFGTNSAEVVMLARELGGPEYSFTAHGSETVDGAQFFGLGEKIRRAKFVVAVCSFGKAQLFRTVEYRHWRKIRIVHCGLESEFYSGAAVPIPKAPRIVCVGRLCEQKGQLLLVEAAALLASKGRKFEIILAGDGEKREEIERLIAGFHLEEQIRITGWISSEQVRTEILASRALVLPSFSEGLPVVIMEAMALRRPVLATYVGGIPELVRSDVDGWLFPAGSTEALAEALDQLLSASMEEVTKMGESGYLRVIERHSIDSEALKLRKAFCNPEDL